MSKLKDAKVIAPAGSGSAMEVGYRIQVRDTLFAQHTDRPIIIAGHVMGAEWQEAQYEVTDHPGGVPLDSLPGNHLFYRLLPLASAMALAYTMLAQQGARSGLEVQIVAYRLETTYRLDSLGPVAVEIKNCHFGMPRLMSELPAVEGD